MSPQLSSRIRQVVEALPLRRGIRVLEIGCGTGAMAREIAMRVGDGHVLGIDRSARAVARAAAVGGALVEAGRLAFRHTEIERFELQEDEAPFDLAVAVRVGVLDGRHPEGEREALRRIEAALAGEGRLFVESRGVLSEVRLREAGPG